MELWKKGNKSIGAIPYLGIMGMALIQYKIII